MATSAAQMSLYESTSIDVTKLLAVITASAFGG